MLQVYGDSLMSMPSTIFAFGRYGVPLSDDFWNYDEKMMSIIDNIEEYESDVFSTIFRNSLKIKFLLILSIFCLEW